MEAKLYNQEGKEVGIIELPEKLFAAKWNADLVHQAVVTEQANQRTPVAHTKGRGEVRGGGKKPWKQKGTGRARHGSSRSPIWVGGGVAHGPTNEKVYARKLNQKMKNRALAAVLTRKLKDDEVLFVDSIKLSEPKTKKAAQVIGSFGKKELKYKTGNRVLVATAGRESVIERSFKNLPTALVMEARNLSPLLLMQYKYVLFTPAAECVDILNKRV